MLKHCASNRNRRFSALSNVGTYIYIYIYIYIYTTLKSLVLQGAPYIYDISRLSVKTGSTNISSVSRPTGTKFQIAPQFCKLPTAICPSRPHLGWFRAQSEMFTRTNLTHTVNAQSRNCVFLCFYLKGWERLGLFDVDGRICGKRWIGEDMEGGGEVLLDCWSGILLEVLRKSTGV
jgi:hypothetical protein